MALASTGVVQVRIGGDRMRVAAAVGAERTISCLRRAVVSHVFLIFVLNKLFTLSSLYHPQHSDIYIYIRILCIIGDDIKFSIGQLPHSGGGFGTCNFKSKVEKSPEGKKPF